MKDGHLDLLELDAIRAGEAPRDHVDSCPRCRAELAWLTAAASRITRASLPPRRRRWPLFASAAAILVAAVGAWLLTPRYAPEDIDRSGRVDILDAYALAVRIERGERDPRWDVNGDGVVDMRDVEAIARKCVLLARRDD